MGQSVEMGTIHAGDFMVSFFVSLIYAYYVFVLSKVPDVYSTSDYRLCFISMNLNHQRRFCSNLGMTNQTVKAAQESVQKSEEFDIR